MQPSVLFFWLGDLLWKSTPALTCHIPFPSIRVYNNELVGILGLKDSVLCLQEGALPAARSIILLPKIFLQKVQFF